MMMIKLILFDIVPSVNSPSKTTQHLELGKLYLHIGS